MFARMGGDPAPHLPRKRVPVPEQEQDLTLLYLVAPAQRMRDRRDGIRIDDGQSAR